MYKLYTTTIDDGAIQRHNSLRANKGITMENLEKRLLPISALHWASHKLVRIPSDIKVGSFHVWEVIGIGFAQKSNYIGLLTFLQYKCILDIIANEQTHIGNSIADLRIVHINYVE